MQVGLTNRVNASMGIVTEAGAGDRQDRGQDDCPPSPLAWLIRGCRSVSSRAYPCHERRARRSRARPSGELSGPWCLPCSACGPKADLGPPVDQAVGARACKQAERLGLVHHAGSLVARPARPSLAGELAFEIDRVALRSVRPKGRPAVRAFVDGCNRPLSA